MTADHGLGALLARGARRLRASAANQGPGATPDLDAELLLTHVLGTSRARLRSHPEEAATDAQSKRYGDLIERRATGEPLAYVLGRGDFWSLRLTVTPAVLVPRPETELLVERALDLRREEFGRVVDLGTSTAGVTVSRSDQKSPRPRT